MVIGKLRRFWGREGLEAEGWCGPDGDQESPDVEHEASMSRKLVLGAGRLRDQDRGERHPWDRGWALSRPSALLSFHSAHSWPPLEQFNLICKMPDPGVTTPLLALPQLFPHARPQFPCQQAQ